MKHYLSIISLALLLVSCSEDDSPAPDANRLSKVIGDKIYTLIQGNNQTGAPGQFLEEDIKILITDLQGKSLRAFSLRYDLSDESGAVYQQKSYSDTVTFKWKLGCVENGQKITVRDLNVCGVAKNECIDADIFDIKANATEEISSGWFMPCMSTWGYTGNGYFVNDRSVAYVSGDKIISTKDLLNPEWESSTIPYNSYYRKLKMITSGEIFYDYNQYKALYSPELNTWRATNNPYYYTNVEMDVTESGNYIIVGEQNNKIFKSNDVSSWTEYMDLNQTTNGNGYRPQLLAVEGNTIYVATNNRYVTEINTLNDKTELHYFGEGIWHTNYYNLGNFDAEVVGDFMFIKLKESYNSSSTLVVLDLSNNTKQVFNLGYNKMFKSAGKLYLISNFSDVRVWDNNGFKQKKYPAPFNYSNSSVQYGIFKGSPIGFINTNYNQQINSSIIYYIE